MKTTHKLITVTLLTLLPAIAPAALPGSHLWTGHITDQIDTNGDTIIDSGEWQQGTERSFDVIDTDLNKSLSPEELDAIEEPIVEELGDLAGAAAVAVLKKLILTLDTDKDGQVSLTEYTAWSDALLKKLDTNEDANVEQAELNELPVRLIGV